MVVKKLLVVAAASSATLALAGFGFDNSTTTQAQDGSNEATMQASFDMGSTPINGIDVPFEVLMYAQLEYQGYAVTHAEKVSWNGQAAYRLRVDRDIYRNDYDGFYLYFDMEWNLVRDEKLQAPPQPGPAPETQPTTPAPETEEQQEESKPEPKPEQIERRPGPIGGNVQGQDENDETQETDNDKNDSADNNETTDDSASVGGNAYDNNASDTEAEQQP